MDTVDVAVKRLKIGRDVREPGDVVPESVDFPNRDSLLKSGRLKTVPLDELTAEQKTMLQRLTDIPIETHAHAQAHPQAQTHGPTHAQAHPHTHGTAHAQEHAHTHARAHAHTHAQAHLHAHGPAHAHAHVEKPSESELRHLGSGWYELPDGSKIRGKQAALEAMQTERGKG